MNYRNLITEVSGQLRFLYSGLVVDDVVDMVIRLVDESLTRWSATGWSRYSDIEDDCTARLVYFARKARREIPSLILCEIHFDSPLLTSRMLEGKVSTVGATRPDLRILVGEIGISIEGKRLGTHPSQPRNYVKKGISRFVTDDYADPSGFGIMVGYVQQGSRTSHVHDINAAIDSHSAMGPTHRLSHLNGSQRCRSIHELTKPNRSTRRVRLEHFLPYLY